MIGERKVVEARPDQRHGCYNNSITTTVPATSFSEDTRRLGCTVGHNYYYTIVSK